ncbi:MAG: class I tRNA ligase family protein, partial [Clostridia bacterium]|nr:class I tRNA ligase family protein [Clostridia bacterium]
TTELSKLYIDITKDRVYAEAADSKARRSAQSAMYYIISALTRLLAPLLAFTAEEIWQVLPKCEGDVAESVYLNDLPSYDESLAFPEITAHYNKLFALREHVMKALELARAEKRIGKSLDASVTVYAPDADIYNFLKSVEAELPTMFIVSQVTLVNAAAPAEALLEEGAPIGVAVAPAAGEKCDRCWNFTLTPSHDEEGGCLCPRCKGVLKL